MINGRYVASCHFIDIGCQPGGHSGRSNVILLFRPGRRKWPDAIVIDCGGAQAETTLRLLRGHSVRRIEHLVVTHNDDDHCGGLLHVLKAYSSRVGCVWFLQDRPAPEIRFYPELKRLINTGAVQKMEFLRSERNRTPRTLYSQPRSRPADGGPTLKLDLLYPRSVEDTMDPQVAGNRNAAGAILYLYCNDRAILFPGDAQIESLRRARDHFSSPAPIRCDVLAAPHHGGKLASDRLTTPKFVQLYTNVVRCDFVVISVATENRDLHPVPEHVQGLTLVGARVMCTQITGRCCHDLVALNEGVLPAVPGIAQASEAVGEANGVACAGTVVVDIGPDRLQPRRWQEHHDAIALINGKPLCRIGPSR
jgi:beta-lactamase superfamily II metal-dependent hydrolase